MNRPNSLDLLGSLLDDVSTLEYILLGDLRDILEESLDETNAKWLAAVIDALIETMPRNFALQDEGGYLQEVVECDANWYGYVRQLSDERTRIYHQLLMLRREIDEIPPREIAAKELRTNLRNWMVQLTAFQRHELRLVQTAFNLDVGIGD